MKQLFLCTQLSNPRFIFQTTPDGGERVNSIAESLKARDKDETLTDIEIQDLATRLAERLPESIDITKLFEEALGQNINPTEVDGWYRTIEAHIEATRMSLETEREESSVEKPLTREQFDEIWGKRQAEDKDGLHIPEDLKEIIAGYVIHNLETKDLSAEDIEKKTIEMIDEQAIFEKVNRLSRTDIETGKAQTETTEKTLQQALEEIAKTHGIDAQIFYRAIAGNFNNFNLDNERKPLAYDKETYLKNAEELAKQLAEKLKEIKESGQNIDTTTPQGQAQALGMLGASPNQGGPTTLLDLFRMFQTIARFGANAKDKKPLTTANGNPLNSALPNGRRYNGETIAPKGRLDQMQAHNGPIQLNEQYYGEELVKQFEQLPTDIQEAAKTISATMQPGWDKAVMRNAVNSHKQGKPFSAQRVFMIHDVTRQTSAIYVPGKGTRYVPSTHGKGVGNQPGSNQTPLGSFTINSMTHLGVNSGGRAGGDRYNYRIGVHGMEPMRARMNADRRTAMSIDPGAGNTNSDGRAIRIHETAGGTAGCTGLRNEDAEYLSSALRQYGGGNFEVITSVG